jgi:hypothetical protein
MLKVITFTCTAGRVEVAGVGLDGLDDWAGPPHAATAELARSAIVTPALAFTTGP